MVEEGITYPATMAYSTTYEKNVKMPRKRLHDRNGNGNGTRMDAEGIMAGILCLYLFCFPWVTYKKEIMFTREERLVVPDGSIGVLDTALHGKACLTILAGVLLAGLMLLGYCRKRQGASRHSGVPRDTKSGLEKTCVTLLCIFSCLNLLSALLGGHVRLSFYGNANSREGILVWLSYAVFFLAGARVFSRERYRKWLKRTVLLLCHLTLVLTAVEFFYRPLMQILYPDIWNTEYPGMAVLTLYNPGYYAVFCTMLFAAAGGIWAKAAGIKEEIAAGIAVYGMAFAVLASKSTGAFYVMAAETAFLIVCCANGAYRRYREKGKNQLWRYVICKSAMTVIAVGLFGIANLASSGKLESVAAKASVNETRAVHKQDYFKLTDILTDGNTLMLAGENDTLVVRIDESESLSFSDEEGNSVIFTEENHELKFKGKFAPIRAWIENDALTIDFGYRNPVHFSIYRGKLVPVLSGGSLVNDISGNGLWRNRFASFATGRGWFWLGSLPVLKHCIFLGHGMGTFQVYFKQYDFVGLLNIHGNPELIIDKPHNLYIQAAVQAGCMAAISLVGIIAAVLCSLWKRMVRGKMDGMGLGIFMAILAFAVMAIITDSSVTYAPLAWILMGAGISKPA